MTDFDVPLNASGRPCQNCLRAGRPCGTHRRGVELKKGRGPLSKKRALEGIRYARGMIASAAEFLECSEYAVREAMERWEDVNNEAEYQRQLIVDTALRGLVHAAESGLRWAIERILDSYGADRGFARETKQTITVEDKRSLAARAADTDYASLPLHIKKAMLEAGLKAAQGEDDEEHPVIDITPAPPEPTEDGLCDQNPS